LNIVVAGLIGDGLNGMNPSLKSEENDAYVMEHLMSCANNIYKIQFMSAVVYGYLIVTSLLIIALFTPEITKIPVSPNVQG